jgi:2-hydroxycyclohexanecarboxyl-CoA dehydrogenase
VDLTKRTEVEKMVKTVLDEFGQIDILVNCAGWDKLEPFVESCEETWEKILAINFKTVLNTTRAVLPHMIARGSGKIVNISSDAGRVGSMWEAVYAGAKGAVVAFSKTVAREVARYKINVNVVCPGLTDTPLLEAIRSQSADTDKLIDAIIKATPFRRVAKPEEVAEAVLFFVSPDSDFITGQTLSVSGGLTMV